MRESSIVVLLVNANFFFVEVVFFVSCDLGLGFGHRCFLLFIFFLFVFLIFLILLGLCAVIYLCGWLGGKFFLGSGSYLALLWGGCGFCSPFC